MMNFAEQGRVYIDRLKTRNRHPIKPASVAAFESYLRNHVIPLIGIAKLEPFNNGALKSFVQALIDKKLAPKTIAEVSAFVRAIVASVLDTDGNQVYPRNWNLDFVDAPPIAKQHQPTVTKEFLQGILRNGTVKVRNRVLLAVLASTGTRIGELLALRIGPDPSDQNTVWDADARMIRVRKSVWRGKLQDPKTAAAVRDIDLSTPVNKMLQEFAKGRKQGEFLFCTKSGKPLEQSYVSTYILKPSGIPGCHALRRLRVSHLREVGCNEDILKAWLGHSNGRDMTNRYSKLSENLELRRTWAERTGTGLNLADALTPQITESGTHHDKAAKKSRRNDPRAELPVVKRSLIRKRALQQPEAAVEADAIIPPNAGSPLPEPISEVSEAALKAAHAEPMYVASDDDLDASFFEEPAPGPTQEEIDAELARLAELRAILEGVS
jgi:site-specific recombinase XerD